MITIALIAAALAAGFGVGFLVKRSRRTSASSDTSGNTVVTQNTQENQNREIEKERAHVKELQAEIDKLKSENKEKSKSGSSSEDPQLKKKLKDQEEEIEDLEDDLDKEKKKRREAETANTELSAQLAKASKDAQNALEAKNDLESRLSRSQDEVRTIGQSIHFVSEILNAEKESGSSNVAKVEEAVNAIFDFVKSDLIPVSKQTLDWDPLNHKGDNGEMRNLYSHFYQWAAQAKKSWIKGKKAIAFVGEFSAGKTSLVNRLLGQNVNDKNDKGILYTSAKAATAVPTYVIGGTEERFRFVTQDDEMKILKKETFTSASKEVMGKVEGLPNLVKYFVMYQNCEALKGFSILDTPGFNSNDPDDATRTIEVINECDALFWVVDVNAGSVNKSSLKIINERYDNSKPLYVVINKVDTKSDNEVTTVENKIKADFVREGVKLGGVIRFGFKSNLSDLLNPISSIQKNDRVDTIVNYLLDDLKDSDKQLKDSLNKLDKDRRALSEQVEEDLGILSGNFESLAQQAEDCSEFIDAHWDPGWFWDDYKMTPDEGRDLIRHLNSLAEQTRGEVENMETFKDHVKDSQEIESKYQDLKEKSNLIANTLDKFKKLIKNYQEANRLNGK